MEKNKYVLTITLNPAIDKTIIIPHFKRGVIYRPDIVSLSAGGKGVNVSKVLTQLGVNTIALGFLPQKGADFIELELDDNKIKQHFIKIQGEVRINLTILNPASKRATRIFEPGGIIRKKDLKQFKQKYLQLLKKASVVVISGSNALGLSDELNGQLVTLAKKAGVLSFLDTSLQPLKLGLKRKPFMVKPNLQEAEEILHMRLRSKLKIKKALKELHQMGSQNVALTDGRKGAYFYNGEEMLQAILPEIEQKNPVGCGDSFVAGFVSYYLKKKSFLECLKFASACGCANAMSINPGEISSTRVSRVLKQIRIIAL